MKNRQTIFKKYLLLSMIAVFLGFAILGVMIVFFVTQYWEAERWDTLNSYATTVSLSITDKAVLQDNKATLPEQSDDVIRDTMRTLSGGIHADIIVTDSSGKVTFSSENAEGIDSQTVIGKQLVNAAMGGGLREVSDFGGIYSEKYYIAGVPVQLISNGELTPIGAVFVTSSTSHYKEYVITLVKIFCSAGIIIFALIFCFVGLFSYQLTKPLGQMAKAAKEFGQGDFTKRVKVDSNDEIGELARAFNTMADSLAASEGMRRAFVANVSHELKTPMTTIAGFIDGILDGTIPRERQSYYLNIVTTEVKRLSRLVTSMLALSRIDSGELKMVKTSFDISSTILNTFLTFEQKLEQRQINVIGLDELSPLYVEGDPDMLHQVVYNLVENASKFTNVGGDITVKTQDKGTSAVISITNTGDGIAPDQIGFIFDRFYKTDKSRSLDKKGMGLGLYLVRSIIRQHGGDISASSVEGEYTTFEFYIPKKKKETRKTHSENEDS